jgi:DNA-binding NtrC family response regulator
VAASVLVVDDLPEICGFFRGLVRQLKGLDVDLVTETNPARALALLDERRFDLVVSDFRMTEHDGADVLTRAHATNPTGIRVLMTGYNEVPTPLSRLRTARVDAYLQKPLRTQDLLLLILHLVQRDASTLDACRRNARELESLAQREEMMRV